jgi:hypothetical protein
VLVCTDVTGLRGADERLQEAAEEIAAQGEELPRVRLELDPVRAEMAGPLDIGQGVVSARQTGAMLDRAFDRIRAEPSPRHRRRSVGYGPVMVNLTPGLSCYTVPWRVIPYLSVSRPHLPVFDRSGVDVLFSTIQPRPTHRRDQ